MPRANASPSTASPHGAALELLRQQSLTSLVRRELERQIESGTLAPGSKLNEADVAADLRVSRGPVREAFRALEQAGLVRTEKNRGVFVRQVSLPEADEIYEVRAALEGVIGRLAAKRVRPAQLNGLRALVKRMQSVARSRDADAYFPLNLEFHDALAQASGNTALLANYRRVIKELNLYRRETLARSVENISISTRDHEAIVGAIAKGDEKLAERLLVEHVINSRERLHRALGRSSPATLQRKD
ncbi:MAG: phosphonate utilization associated transcriptional regulator [Burkholderiales bacterium]